MKKLLFLFMALMLQAAYSQQRPREDFIFRGVLPNNKVRMILVSLSSNMTAVYDGTTAGLYQVWSGQPEDNNANASGDRGYGHREWGSTFEPRGNILHTQSSSDLWDIRQGNSSVDASVRYMGYSVNGTDATIKYDVTLPSDAVIHVEETPEYNSGDLERAISISGIPQGMEVRIRLGGNGGSWTVSGTGSIVSSGGTQWLSQDADGETTITGNL